MSKERSSLFHFTDQEIRLFFRSGKRIVQHELGDVIALPRRYRYGRLIVIIPKRIANAARRNRIRRQLKAIFYENRAFEKPLDIMIIIKSNGATASFRDLQSLLFSVIKKNA